MHGRGPRTKVSGIAWKPGGIDLSKRRGSSRYQRFDGSTLDTSHGHGLCPRNANVANSVNGSVCDGWAEGAVGGLDPAAAG